MPDLQLHPAPGSPGNPPGRPSLPAAVPDHAVVYTIEQIAEKLQLSMSTLHRRQMQIPGRRKWGRAVRFSRAIVDDWIERGCPGL